MSGAHRRAAVVALGLWLALIASVAAWPLAGGDAGLAALAALPLLLPLPGLVRQRPRALRFAPLAEGPALALALMEVVANPAARSAAAATLALALAAFAGTIAALRGAPRG